MTASTLFSTAKKYLLTALLPLLALFAVLTAAPVWAMSDITVTPANLTINIGQTQQFTATGTFSDGTSRTLSNGDGTWVGKASMPTPRFRHAVGMVNGTLYAVGGRNGSGALATVEAYDPATNTWTPKASMSTPRYAPAVGVVNGILYVVGGSNGSGRLATVEAYDPATNTWTPKASMSTPRHELAVGVVNSTLYAVGGGSNSSNNLATVEAYDPATNTWTDKAPMFIPREGPAVGVVNGILYVVGGTNGSGRLATVEAYDPATNIWTPKASMPTPRFWLAVGVVNSMLYAVGGDSGGTPATVEAYDPATNTWTAKASMPTPRYGPAVGVVNGTLYAVGGSYYDFLGTVEAYTPSDEVTWSSSNNSVATIDAIGLTSGLSSGITTITATSGSVSGSTTISVIADTPTDSTPPALTMPSLAGNYTVGSSAFLSFSATDTLSQLASVSATLNGIPVSSGSTVVLNQMGTNTFTLTATDNAGNTATQTQQFTVTYTFSGFLPPLTADSHSVFHLGSVIPVKFDLFDASGMAISTAIAHLSLQQFSGDEPFGTPIDATSTSGADSGNLFRYSGGHYIYNLSTRPLSAGIWEIQATLDDGSVRTIRIGLSSR